MFCPKCGHPNADGAPRCENCQTPLHNPNAAAPDGIPTGAPPPPPASAPYYAQQQTPPPQQPARDPYYAAPPIEKPRSLLPGNIVLAVLGLCFCVPTVLSIIGIIFGAQVGGRFDSGDLEGARSSARIGRVLFFISLSFMILSVILLVIGFVFMWEFYTTLESYGFYDLFDSFYQLY